MWTNGSGGRDQPVPPGWDYIPLPPPLVGVQKDNVASQAPPLRSQSARAVGRDDESGPEAHPESMIATMGITRAGTFIARPSYSREGDRGS